MREVGTLVWVVLLIVGVVASMISSIRRQIRTQQTGQSPAQQTGQSPAQQPPRRYPAQQPPQYQPVPAPAPRRQQPEVPQRGPQPTGLATPAAGAEQDRLPGVLGPAAARRPFFPHKSELARAVIAAEVLGKPRALSDEYLRR